MCGIAGYIRTTGHLSSPTRLQQLARSLLLGIETRGHDATGYGYVESGSDKAVCVTKAPIKASEFLAIDGHLLAKRKLKKMPTNLLLHTRSATQGKPENNSNNHPVYSKASGLCLIHNGWAINDEEVKKNFKLDTDAQVDTEVYLKLIEHFYFGEAKMQVPQAVALATEQVWGNFSCAMIQGGKPQKLWVWRTQGDLELVRTDLGYVFCSKLSDLRSALYFGTHSCDITFLEWLNLENNMLAELRSDGSAVTIKLKVPEWETLPTQYSNRVTPVQTWYSGNMTKHWQRKKGITTEPVKVQTNLPTMIEKQVEAELGLKSVQEVDTTPSYIWPGYGDD